MEHHNNSGPTLRAATATGVPARPGVVRGPVAAPEALVEAQTSALRVLRWLLCDRGWRVVRPLADLLAASMAVALAFSFPQTRLDATDVPLLAVLPPLVVVLLALRGAYRSRFGGSMLDDLARAVSATSMAVVVLVAVQVYATTATMAPGDLVHVWGLGIAMLGSVLVTGAAVQRSARRAGLVGRRTLIVGAGVVGERIARRLLENPEYGLVPVGFLDAQPPERDDRVVPVLGSTLDLEWIAELADIEHVVLAFSATSDSEFVPVVRRSEELGLGIAVVPRLFDAFNDRASYETVGGLPVHGLSLTDPRGLPFLVKHCLDRTLAAAALLVLSPLLLLLAALVRLSSPGPVLFRQRRVGRDGKPFDLLKFRSMRPPAAGAAQFRPADGSAPGGVEGEDRRTLIGRVLRRTSLDELPQLINVVRGEMSLVGPRPERPEFVERFREDVERYGERHRVKAGITGWAQVNGLRGQTSISDRAEWDNYYIEHWSLWLDVKVLLLTVLAVFRSAE